MNKSHLFWIIAPAIGMLAYLGGLSIPNWLGTTLAMTGAGLCVRAIVEAVKPSFPPQGKKTTQS